MLTPEEIERRQKMRELYDKYKGHLPEDKNVIFRNTNEAFYAIREEKKEAEKISPVRVSTVVKPRVRKNRFKNLSHPKAVRKAVRSWIFHTIDSPKKPFSFVLFKDAMSFVVSTGIIFCLLLVIFNFEAYKNVVSYWWEANIVGGGETQKNFAHFTKKEEPLRLSAPDVETTGITKRSEAPSIQGTDIPVVPSDNRIIISKIGQNIPIKEVSAQNLIEENWKALEDDLQTSLKDGVVRYPGTAQPGQIGNVFVTGHSSYYLWDPGRYKDVFALLHNVEVGDTVTVFYNQNRYDYIIEEKKVVSPTDVDVLAQTNDKRLTLMTCTPIGTALNRLILVAKQIE